MKHYLRLLLALLIIGCSSDDDTTTTKSNPNLIGTWKLIEQLQDPGDGNGTFKAVTSDRTFTFNTENTVVVNGNICFMRVDVGDEISATYNMDANDASSGKILTGTICNTSGFNLNYTIEGQFLIVSYPCIEACAQKFEKL
ncbi:hypothetical protein [uncultured Algibacter sp.]|uniref:hypothetical protein n=1 Tax=uncultured Algibacter sp. TaxID=298659 RepID=UPI0032180A4C